MDDKDITKPSTSANAAKQRLPVPTPDNLANGVSIATTATPVVMVTKMSVPPPIPAYGGMVRVTGAPGPRQLLRPPGIRSMSTVDRGQASALGLTLSPTSPHPRVSYPQVTPVPATRPPYLPVRPPPAPPSNMPGLVPTSSLALPAAPVAALSLAKPPAGQVLPTPSPGLSGQSHPPRPRPGTSPPRAATPSRSPVRSPIGSPSSPASTKIQLTDLNPHLLCVLCGGYLVDATTIIECLHSFCRTCIHRYLESSKYCPICDVQVHKTKPLINCRTDNTLQTLVYKLVPGLFKEEMKRRREFYAANPDAGPPATAAGSSPRDKPPGESEKKETSPPPKSQPEKEKMSVCLQHSDRPPIPKSKRPFPAAKDGRCDVRYLLCPPDVSVSHLKKFLRLKFDLGDRYKINFYYTGDMCLKDRITLEDIALIYAWKKDAPLKLYWVVQDLTIPLPEAPPTRVKHKNPPKPQKRKPAETPQKDTKKKKVDHGTGGDKEGRFKHGQDNKPNKRAQKAPSKQKSRKDPAKRSIKVTPLRETDVALAGPTPEMSANVPKETGAASLDEVPIQTEPTESASVADGSELCKFAVLNNNLSDARSRLESENIDSGISDSQADSDRSTDGGEPPPEIPETQSEPDSDDKMGTEKPPGHEEPKSKAQKSAWVTAGTSKGGKPSTQTTGKKSPDKNRGKKTPRPPKKVTVRSGVRKRLSPAQQIRIKKLKHTQSPPGIRSALKKSPLGLRLGVAQGTAVAGKVAKSRSKSSTAKGLKLAVSQQIGRLKNKIKSSKSSNGKQGEIPQKS